ncbi:LEA type 2 family protein [Ideonella dechloratans]|uniref:LEA type 2 family protein n=1 Tax=Ideonella dechloratans TaxID=36863 RepID=UPI0035AFD951
MHAIPSSLPSLRLSAWRARLLALAGALLLAACAGFGLTAPRVTVADLEGLPSKGLEMRFLLRLRVQNPNATDLDYDGLNLELKLAGKGVASGVTNAKGTLPRYGETMVEIPVTVSTFNLLKQAWGMAEGKGLDKGDGQGVPYELHGQIGTALGRIPFDQKGTLNLPR